MAAAQLSVPPLALYAHFPWCVRKCPYCDFNSHTLQSELPVDAYVDALLEDLRGQQAAAAEREIVSIFFGGGTPSLFPPAAIERLLSGIRAQLTLAADAEITLEANPGTVERGRFAAYRAAGINRVSLGAQSFGARQLQVLGRIHSADETRAAAQELHAAGLPNFNLDLMFGLPEQSIDGALADIDAALALEPAHISHYQLTLEPGTVFGGRPPTGLPDADLSAEMQLQCQQRLAAARFQQYEVSAYARAGYQCRHNLNYWRFGDYLGIGAGAHGKLTDVATGRIERTTREREPRRYLARGSQGIPASQVVRAADRPFEFMMNALRLNDGFRIADFEQRTGVDWSVAQPVIVALETRGLLELRDEFWRTTALGGRFLNDVLAEFLAVPRAERQGLGRKTSEAPKA
jgi:oxygen-independent coproporphyrinogen-3 oxidase